MKKSRVISQLLNVKTKLFYYNNCKNIAQNVFPIKNMPSFIDKGYVNDNLTNEGSIAFFEDEVLGLLALPFVNLAGLDVYNRPIKIQVIGANGYTRILNRDEFVIMYDNLQRRPISDDIDQFATRLANLARAKDVNINQLKIPRIWQCPQELKLSLEKLLDDIEGNIEKILTYKGLDIQEISAEVQSIESHLKDFDEEQRYIWNEFLSFCGVSNLTINKKERVIRDEVLATMGGTLISKMGRYEARKDAVDEINRKFGTNLEVVYYEDYINNNLENIKSEIDEEEGEVVDDI